MVICGEQSSFWTGFSPSTSVSLVNTITPLRNVHIFSVQSRDRNLGSQAIRSES